MNNLRLKIKAVPGARCDQIAGWLGDRLKVRVAVPAEDGRANEAIRALIAERLGLKRRDISIVAGVASAEKTLEIAEITDEQLARLGGWVVQEESDVAGRRRGGNR